MNRIKLGGGASHLALACVATALLAAACNRTQTAATTAPPLDALPLTSNTTGPADPAPLAAALPAAAPVRIARLAHPEQGYAYLDRAHAASEGYADAPPDYAVDYNGERPWIWRGGDKSERVVERTPEGLRYYYYEPGASEPYLIQDPNYGYAYSGGQLVAVYGQDGQLEPYEIEQRRSAQAGRYLAWAAGLYAASQHQQRVAVEQARWRQQQAYIAGQRNAWAEQQTRYQAWNDYHQAHAEEETAHWAPERDRRQAELVRYGAPQNNGSQGGYPGGGYQGGNYQGGPQQGGYPGRGGYQGQDQGQVRQAGQAYGQPGGYPQVGTPSGGYGYDPNGGRNAAAQAGADRRQGFSQPRPDLQAQRQGAEQAHVAQMQAVQAQQAQAHAVEVQRQASLQQGRAAEQAQRQAAEQAHARQMQAEQVQARAAETQRQASLQQGRAAEQAQRQAAEQAHATQMQAVRSQQQQAQAAASQRQASQREAAQQQARVEAENQRQAAQQARTAQLGEQRAQAAAEHQAAMQQVQAANVRHQAAMQQVHAQAEAQHQAAMQQQAAQHAAQPHPGAPSAHEGPHGDHEHHAPGEQH